jgi:hypothetical protein
LIPVARPVLTIVLGALIVVAAPTPVLADAAGPTNYRSRVLDVEPDADGIDVEVLGGDSFLRVTARPGVEVVILGYGDGGRNEEPYVRIEADGTVLVNVRSPAYYLNDSRFLDAGTTAPPAAAVDAEPAFQVIGEGGSHAWHDHRVHWMSPEPPQSVHASDGGPVVVFERWEVPLIVDGEPVTVAGELVWLPDEGPVIPLLVLLIAGAAALALLVRGGARPDLVLAAGAVVATVAAIGGYLGAEVDRSVATTHLIVAAAAALLGVMAVTLRGSRPKDSRLLAGLAGVATLAYALQNLGVLTAPVLPFALPDVVTRALVAAAIGLAAAGLVDLVRRSRASEPTEQAPPAQPT